MVLSAPPTICKKHRRRERVAACGACGAGLCSECVVHTAVGIKCRSCTGVAVTATRVEGGTGRARQRRWAAPVAVMGLVVVAVAGFALTRDGGGGSGTTVPGDGGQVLATAVDRPVTLEGAGELELGATLTLPAGAGGAEPVPGVLIVPGGATLDRNNLLGFGGAVADPLYEDVSLATIGNGMAVLRYDRRGTASSRPVEGPRSFDDHVVDAQAGVEFLAQRRELSGAPLALVGYDDGGLVALRVAASDPRIQAVVLISTTGRPLVDYLAADFVANDPDAGPALAASLRAAVGDLLAGRGLPPQGDLPPALAELLPADPDVAGYLQDIFSLVPAEEARPVSASVLYLRGGLDTAITDADVAAFQGALGGAMDVMVSPEGGHSLLLPVDHGAVVHEGADETPRDSDLLTRMGEWLATRLAP